MSVLTGYTLGHTFSLVLYFVLKYNFASNTNKMLALPYSRSFTHIKTRHQKHGRKNVCTGPAASR